MAARTTGAGASTGRPEDWDRLLARRLATHRLLDPEPAGADRAQAMTAVVDAILGAHAQVMVAGETSIGLRVDGATRSDVRHAVEETRTLVKAHGPRGTVHLLSADGLARWVGAMSWIGASGSTPPVAMRLTPEQTETVLAALGTALAGAELTVDELDEAVIGATGPWAGDLVMPAFGGYWPRWRQLIGTSGHRGLLCFGRPRGRKVTYTSPRTWLPGFDPRPGARAAVDLVHAYLAGYGPATAAEFATWLAIRPARAVELFARAEQDPRLVRVDRVDRVDRGAAGVGVACLDVADAPDVEPGMGQVRLLPLFDAYGVGSRPRERIFPGRASERALAGGQAGNFPVVLVDGVVAGVWHQRLAGKRVRITVEMLEPPTAARRNAVEDQVDRVAAVLEATPDLTFGEITVGAHA
ncbi:winged helix DNA-binding domain-containing protein [Occultella glacieicola]|uniref:Winged helix DNA-binding domain-containing protein n=1 Tax=Occultella glacieicola TaxID=2518684 RepID=A0ABY2E8P9_9MICO|nr:winged helix DNA-binding domain-containing protein [Occultella glacieicola]TDE98891.1 winged helix DNA-binding domain-containing protein [Occultella glacieicola]